MYWFFLVGNVGIRYRASPYSPTYTSPRIRHLISPDMYLYIIVFVTQFTKNRQWTGKFRSAEGLGFRV